MDRFPIDAEAGEHLITKTREQFSALSHAVLAGEPVATKRITDALGDFLSDDNAAAELVRAVLTNSQAALTVMTDLLWAEAAEIAERDVADMERRRAEEAQHARIERMAWNREIGVLL